jgi:hypothetical protein
MTETTTLEAIIDRYFDTWNETDDERRLALCAEVWADDGRYVDPFIDATGPRAISDSLGGLQASHPGYTVQRTTAIDAHHDQARFGWNVVAPDGTVAYTGIDVVMVTDGRLQALSGFFGEIEPAAA